MKRLLKPIAAGVLLGAGIFLGSAGGAAACSCAGARSPEDWISRQKIIFEAMAVKVELVREGTSTKQGAKPGTKQGGGRGWYGGMVRTTFYVFRVYKGRVPRTVVVYSRLTGPACGWQPRGIGRPGIFAAHRYRGRLSTSICTMLPLLSRRSRSAVEKAVRALPARDPE